MNQENAVLDERLLRRRMSKQQVVEMQERLLAKAGVTKHNFGDKALEAIYNHDTQLQRAIICLYVLPLQEKENP